MVRSSHFSRLKTPKSLRQQQRKKQHGDSTSSIYELQVLELDEHGCGLARSTCGQLFKVPYVLPGERCTARGQAGNDILELIEVSGPGDVHRQQAACTSFGICGGCQFQHMPHSDQLEFKRKRLWHALLELTQPANSGAHCGQSSARGSKQGLNKKTNLATSHDQASGLRKKSQLGQKPKLGQKSKLGQKPKAIKEKTLPAVLSSKLKNLEDVECLAHEPLAYRRRARLDVSADGQLGFRQARSNETASIDNCPVLTQPLQDIIESLNLLMSEMPELDWRRHIGHVELLDVEPQPLILIRLVRPIEPVAFKRILTVVELANWRLGLQHERGGDYQMVVGNEASQYELLGQNITFKPGRFIQVNDSLNQAMVQQAINWLQLKGDEQVLDLFCGVGNFSFALASQAKRVLGIELSQEMVSIAKQNATHLNCQNVDFICANLDIEGGLLADHEYLNMASPDVVLLDPPRAGASGFIPALLELSPQKILYISCHQGSLMRDLKPLGNAGYQLEKISIMDMFPNTEHVECMALLSVAK